MKIAGFQRVSLLDFPGRVCSILFTQGCVFRCGYCHNPDLIPIEGDESYSQEFVLDQLEKRKPVVDSVCITGGEPTIHADLGEFIALLVSRGFHVKLDTNGMRPDVLASLVAKNLLSYIAMDIKAPWERYHEVSGVPSEAMTEKCKETFSLIQKSGIPHEFRTTIHPAVHRSEDFFQIASYLTDGETYYIQKTAFKKNLDPSISQESAVDAEMVCADLQSKFPHLTIRTR